MKVSSIIQNLTNRGYRVTRSMNSGNIVVTGPHGYFRIFDSYHQVYLCMIKN